MLKLLLHVVASADILAMIAEGDGSTVFTTAGQLALSSPSVSAVEAKLPYDAQSDLHSHLVDIESDVADVVSDIISSVADVIPCTSAMMTSAASNTCDYWSTPVCTATVSASADNAVEDMQLVDVKVNGNCYLTFNTFSVNNFELFIYLAAYEQF